MSDGFEEFESAGLKPEEIRADKLNIRTIILAQMNRLDFLLSIGLGEAVSREKLRAIAYGAQFSLAALESLMSNTLLESENYQTQVEPIKQQLFSPSGYRGSVISPEKNSAHWKEYIEGLQNNASKHVFMAESSPAYSLQLCMIWYSLLVLEMGKIGLVPTKDDDLVFE